MPEPTITELQASMTAGELTAVSLVETYLGRIAALDKSGPTLNSVIELNPDALDIAAALDAERQATGPRGPLHGIPILLKENIDTADKLQTTAGSLALVGSTAAQDATVAAKLRAAGAVILGKTNLSEWANFRSNRSISGWSSRGGQTRNPYALDRNPCGSSSGSAVAVAADLCAAAVGTETDGSIICPAQTCGIVGIKPTLGLVSRAGIIPIAHSQDTAGPMARTVADAALLLGVLAGPDPREAMNLTPWPPSLRGKGEGYSPLLAGEGAGERSGLDYTRFLDKNGLAGARIGVARNYFGFNDRVDRIMDASILVLRNLGAEIVDPANIETAKQLDETELEVLLYEFKADLNAYLAGLGPDAAVHSLAEVIEFNERNRERVMPYFGQDLMLMAEAKGPLTDEAYLKALATGRRLARDEGIDATLQKHGLDAIVAPSGGPAWLTDYVCGDHYGGGSSSPAAVAGYPNVTVPAGYVYGLPVGISFMGAAWSEPALIKFAYAFEQATQARRAPEFRASVDLGA
ncbi:MAG: amidase family protein [Chloroflexi bacterium]|nr:amidase family protein [Chloroflexota bacterium]